MVTVSQCQQAKHDLLKTTRPRSETPAFVSIELVILALNDVGVIQNCNQTCEQVFGYRKNELSGCHVSTLLPQLKDIELVLEDRINSRLAFLCHCAIPFQARHRNGHVFATELFINRLNQHNVVVLLRSLEMTAQNPATSINL